MNTQGPLRPIAPAVGKPGQSPGSTPFDEQAQRQYQPPDPCGDRYAIDTIQASPPLDPGESITLHGCGFGTMHPGGTVRLLGDFPGGYLELERKGWGPHTIAMRVPPVSGVQDMSEARLQVIRADGTPSNWFDGGGFRAAREVKRLGPGDLNVVCGTASSECQLAQNHPASESSFYGNSTVAARHTKRATPKEDCSALEMLGSSSGPTTDRVSIQLANGWALTGLTWNWGKERGNGTVTGPSTYPTGPSATVDFVWDAFTNRCAGPYESTIRYRAEFWAEGPRGVPSK